MSLVVNLRHLAARDLALAGKVPVRELDLETHDELIQVASPLEYELEVQKLEESLLVRGELRMTLDCQCVRCLKPLQHALNIKDWLADVPLAGEERAPVVNDCVDLTPYVREDILLAFPQHPLCRPDCCGLKINQKPKAKSNGAKRKKTDVSAWAELDKLKF